MILVVWKYAKIHQNTFLTTSDIKKIFFFRPWFWWSGTMRKWFKTRFEPLQTLKISFFRPWFWWSGSMCKCTKTSFLPLQTIKNGLFSDHYSGGLEVCANASKHLFNHFSPKIFFQAMIMVVWNYAQMHQNTFWTTSDIKNIFFQAMILVVWKYAQMHQNIFFTTSDLKKYFFQAMILVVWKFAQMHQNTIWTTSDTKNIFFSCHESDGLIVCANASKHVFNHFRP